jgi:regulatory protein
MSDSQSFLFARALAHLTRRPQSVSAIREYLESFAHKKTMRIDPETLHADIDAVVERLLHERLLDDKAFASWWIDQRTRVTPRGWRVIVQELKQEGVSMDVIDSLKEDRFAETQAGDEREVVMMVLSKKMSRFPSASREELYRKLGGSLIRKGFAPGLVYRCIDELLQKKV